MGFTGECMKAMMEEIDLYADKLWSALQADDQIDRRCSCGADKRIEAPGSGRRHVRYASGSPASSMRNSDTLTNNRLEMILVYALAKYPPEKCDEGCPHSHEWLDI